MSRAGRLWAALAAALLAAMGFLAATVLGPEAGGRPAFDIRVTGYGADTARAYLGALSDRGRALYLREMRVLDTLFPAALYLAWRDAVWQAQGPATPWPVRAVALAPGLIYLLADLWENAAIAEMLRAGPQALEASAVARASALTVAKWALLAVMAVLLAALWTTRKHRKHKEAPT